MVSYMRIKAIYLYLTFLCFLTLINFNTLHAIDDTEIEGLINKLFHQTKEERSEEEYRRLFALLKPLAESGDVEARYYLSMFYAGGRGGVEKDIRYAYQMVRELAEEGYAPAQYAIGFEYEMGSVHGEPDNEKAIYWYQKASESGLWLATDRLITAYENGELGLKVDLEKAAMLKSNKSRLNK